MSQRGKRARDRSAEKAPPTRPGDGAPRWSWAGFIIAAVVLAVVLTIVGIFYYQERVAPFQRVIISVDDTTIDMGYFLKRARLAGADSISMLQTLTNEQVIKVGAPRLGIAVSAEDIDQTLKASSNTTSESEFRAWYRQTLNENKLSDAEYRDIVTTSLLSARLQQYLAERMPTVAEQIHLHAILLNTLPDAEKIRARWKAGEDFAVLAREVSIDSFSREKGGDLGWFPRGVLPRGLEFVAFDLSTDNVSEPLPYSESDPSSEENVTPVYYLLKVSERAAAREIDENFLPVLKGQVLNNWLATEIEAHKVRWYGLNSENFDSETAAWLSYQLAKMAKR